MRTPRGCGVLIAQAGEGERRAIWGPASVEMESRDGKIISMSAIEEALPQLILRGALSVLHRDQIVGRIHETMRIPPEAAAGPVAERLAREFAGVFRTGLHVVTQAIADAFPRLRPFIGTSQLFVAASLYNDGQTTTDLAWREITEGKLDSFSISGAALEATPVERDGPGGRRMVEHVTRMDLSATTLASSTPARRGVFTAVAQNPAAALLVIQQSNPPEVMPTTTTPIQQTAPAEAPQRAPLSEDSLKEALTEAFRRIEGVETGLAEVRGMQSHASPKDTTPQAPPTQEAEAAPGEAEDTEEPPGSADAPEAKKDDESDEDDDEDEEKVKPMSQATPTQAAPTAGAGTPQTPNPQTPDLARLIEQAVTGAMKPISDRLAALEQATHAKAPTPQPATPTLVGRPSIAETPTPSAPPQIQPSGRRAALVRLVEAAQTGDTIEFREAFRAHGPQLFPQVPAMMGGDES